MLFIFSTFLATLLVSIVSTQIILAEVQSFGLSISTEIRVNATIEDLLGLAPALYLLISIGFLVGFIIAKYAYQLIGGNRILWYVGVGITSFPITIHLIQYVMGLTPIASARTPLGLFLTTCCCIISAWLFAFLTSHSAAQPSYLGNNNEQ